MSEEMYYIKKWLTGAEINRSKEEVKPIVPKN